MHKYVCVSGGKKCLFFGKFGVLSFLITSAFLVLRNGELDNWTKIFEDLTLGMNSLRNRRRNKLRNNKI